MNPRRFAAGWAALVAATVAGAQSTSPQNQDAARKAFVEAGPKTPMAVFPVRLAGKPARNVGDALGLVLEKSGMTSVEPSQESFDPPADTAWEDVPARLREHVAQNPIRTRYALYAEFVGTPQNGVESVRWLVVDSAGQPALSDCLNRGDPELKRLLGAHPEPMTCCTTVAERLFTLTGWSKGAGPEKGQGVFERLWAEKSGTPDDAEFKAMKARLASLRRELKGARILVLPTRIADRDDAASAARLATALKGRLGCPVSATGDAVRLAVKGSSNEQKVLWDFARALREHLRGAAPDADYVLMGDVLADLEQKRVGAVHFVLCDRRGDWVAVDFQNNHHEDFERISPATLEDCEKLIVERLAGMLK